MKGQICIHYPTSLGFCYLWASCTVLAGFSKTLQLPIEYQPIHYYFHPKYTLSRSLVSSMTSQGVMNFFLTILLKRITHALGWKNKREWTRTRTRQGKESDTQTRLYYRLYTEFVHSISPVQARALHRKHTH